jgi:hypothetical protein
VDHEFEINLADGEPSERFFLHFNARLADLQRQAQGSAFFLPDGEFVSRCSGTFEVAGAERPIEWRVATSAGGGIRSVFIATPDEHGDDVREVAEVLVRDSLQVPSLIGLTRLFIGCSLRMSVPHLRESSGSLVLGLRPQSRTTTDYIEWILRESCISIFRHAQSITIKPARSPGR